MIKDDATARTISTATQRCIPMTSQFASCVAQMRINLISPASVALAQRSAAVVRNFGRCRSAMRCCGMGKQLCRTLATYIKCPRHALEDTIIAEGAAVHNMFLNSSVCDPQYETQSIEHTYGGALVRARERTRNGVRGLVEPTGRRARPTQTTGLGLRSSQSQFGT